MSHHPMRGLTSGALMDQGGIIVSKTQSQSSGEDVLACLPIPRKLRAIMLAQAIPPARRWVIAALTRPFSLREALIACPLLLAVGVVYCQIYCLLALQQMHGASMPVLGSVARAGSDVIPAFVVFEIGKRVSALPRARRAIGFAVLLIGGIALGVLIRRQFVIMSPALTVRHMAVDRIPFMLLAAMALTYYWRRARHGGQEDPWPDAGRERIPPAKAIDWVKAAGNYVEIRMGGRTRLLRMTLRQARALLPGDQFVQIHRSVIVNRDRIAAVRGRRSVEMADGTSFAVGDAHRSNLPDS
jgi:hypothetical protein